MAFDATKVQFTQEELDRIRDADEIYETVAPAIADGFQWSDLAIIGVVLSQGKRLVEWLMAGSKRQLGYKLIAIGTGMIRDNEFLGDDEELVSGSTLNV